MGAYLHALERLTNVIYSQNVIKMHAMHCFIDCTQMCSGGSGSG